MNYCFTATMGGQQCRMCGKRFNKSWHDNENNADCGPVCRACYEPRRNLDLVEIGLVRNIKEVMHRGSRDYEFEALIDGVWRECHLAFSDWSRVRSGHPFSVPVGSWELEILYEKHYKGKEDDA